MHDTHDSKITLQVLKNIFSYKVVWVAALGYFIDIYDLVLFGVVRVSSLTALGIEKSELMSVGSTLLNIQMIGMLIGGFAWGILGDKYGRMKTLYGSIFLYSSANILNAFATDIPFYAVCRFLAGVGLAGELGVAVTIVSETLPQKIRALGAIVIGLAGFLGAMCAATLGGLVSWNISYLIGGGLGFLLLLARMNFIFKISRNIS